MSVYTSINYKVMKDTVSQYESIPELKDAVKHSIAEQYLVKHEDVIVHSPVSQSSTKYIVSPKRSLEAAGGYPGKKVAVLNFANNHDVGGAPFSAGAQEESICRCSILYPCLQAMWVPFYKKHQDLYNKGTIDHVGNDDLIYTPDVVVFKTDERTDPVYPCMMPRDKWFNVDIITCAAPELRGGPMPGNYENVMRSRIRKILDVAAAEKVEVLILGAWGCGAFRNPADVVAGLFHELLPEYDFETVEFALSKDGESVFHREFASELKSKPVPQPEPQDDTVKETIISLLKATGRENIDKMISWMNSHSFFEASASKSNHNAFKGGLARHSLDVYHEAIRLNKTMNLPETSVTLCALLHDVCKADQFYVDEDGVPQSNKTAIDRGHGRRSMFIVLRAGLPLNYDESMAIWWHMGENEDSLKKNRDKFMTSYEESKKIDLCKLIRQADWIAANNPSSETVASVENPVWKRDVNAGYGEIKREVSYNPKNHHWYLDTHSIPLDQYPTRQGPVTPASLTRRMEAVEYCTVYLGAFSANDIRFLRDSRNRIGVFTLVTVAQDLCGFYRTDRKGFGYQSAILYVDVSSRDLPSAHHYLLTEDLDNKWSLVDLYHSVYNGSDYFEILTRDKIAKGFDSEKEALMYFRNVSNGPDLTDVNRFTRVDPSVPLEEPRQEL
jgi:uncharacterized protein (TIGR02452 family)